MERLQKYLARAGVASRRKCEELIVQGQVSINDRVVGTLGVKVDPEQDIVKVDNQVIIPEKERIYLMLHKPSGYMTTIKDTHNRPTIMNLIPEIKIRVFPVGRLDFETKGLLLLTNDGQLTYQLTHPKYKIYKTYQALVQGHLQASQTKKLKQGIQLADGWTAPAQVKIKEVLPTTSLVQISIYEGRNRQVRRMFEEIGHPVKELTRTGFGSLVLDIDLGKYRFLTKQEIKSLKLQTGVDND